MAMAMMKRSIFMKSKMAMRVILSVRTNQRKTNLNRRLVFFLTPNVLRPPKKTGLKSQILQDNNLQF